MPRPPETHYARTSDGVHVASQVWGEGPDLLMLPGFISHLELAWDPLGTPPERMESLSQLLEDLLARWSTATTSSTRGPRWNWYRHQPWCCIARGDVAGLAVHIAARVAAAAASDEVLVSGTTADLVVGSRLHFEDTGPHALKGIAGTTRLLRVREAATGA